jgi:outer membrane protein assembly factor BamB
MRIAWFILALVLGTSATVFAEPATAPAPDHPFGWRGDGSGRFPDVTPLLEWSATKNVRWSTVVGKGYSSPILLRDAVVVTAEPNLILCLARADGAIRWKSAVSPADLADAAARTKAAEYEPPKDGSGMAAATPVTDGKQVYAVFANGIVGAMDLEGKRKWTAYIDADPSLGYGRASSPLLVDGKLIVHMTHLYAFDAATGKQVWMNDHAKSSYGTPAIMTVGGAAGVITAEGDVIRLSDGETLNSALAHVTHSSPAVDGDVVYFAGSSVAAIRLDAKLKEKELWTGTLPEDPLGSPMLHDGVLFTVTPAGELFAFDVKKSGEQMPLINARKLFDPPAAAASPMNYSSLTLAGNHLFLGSNKGEMVVMEATREAKIVARNRLPAGSGASPVFTGGDMIVRDGDRIWCIGK